MNKKVEFYFDVGSPASYLAWTQITGLAQRHDAELAYKPMLLGGVFKATGNSSPATVPAKGRYTREDFQRYARRYAVPFQQNPFFPINTMQLMRGAAAYLGTDRFVPYVNAVFQAIWVDQQDMGNPEVVAAVLSRHGFDMAELQQKINDPVVKDQLRQITEEAIERGVFGAPTFFAGDEMFFGQDRLEFVEEALSRAQ
ncbi:2-hydroxychromene-2-carboxylate isomerase [Halopseudomonas bauzanensis]|uniref:2-hydroxychromene-2-carboxylate isomerase n=1 Tax=Halopseudomonas bauzanensis TaxID=653930 RepID=A0A1I4LDU2_9GAMM|nr:2-hydroxychromene-2-carboxylate isomerase [Halopseudomonas bauzanensis]SER92917.1 2-hydroxychromene-2-carboxylate isomerase [Halopseudomonas bauzanensis]SFL89184.1 2-hydroxychromene-2-carboxylate isomerase [Halopseudomonas bauzanensis]